MSWTLTVRRRRRTGEVALELSVEVVALSEAANQHDAGDDAPLGAKALDLALD